MKSKTVIILWSVAIVLGVIACIVRFGDEDDIQAETNLTPGDKVLPGLPVMEISNVTLKKGDSITHLKKLDKDAWGVEERDDYPIDYEKLRNLLGSLRELEVAQAYAATSKHYPRFSLAEASDDDAEQGLHVTMEKSDGTIAADFFLGKFTGSRTAAGRFMRITSDDTGVYSVEETFPGVTASPRDWISTDFLKVTDIKSIAVSAPGDPGFKSWKLIRHPNTDGTVNANGQLKLASLQKDEVMQIGSTNALRTLFANTSFQDVLTEGQAGETANPDPKLRRVAIITTYAGLRYTITFWPQKDKPKDPNADPRLPAVQPDYLLTVSISTDPEASDQDEVQQKTAQAKLDAMQHLKGRIFQVGQSIISPLQKKRSEFVKSTGSPSTTTPATGLPGLRQPPQVPR